MLFPLTDYRLPALLPLRSTPVLPAGLHGTGVRNLQRNPLHPSRALQLPLRRDDVASSIS